MATDQQTEAQQLHGGRLVAKRLKAHGVSKLFTLSGGHIFSIYDGCREEGIDIVDTRHEQTAAFAAEGWAKATRQVGVAALTAGPGVTNAMSALGSSLHERLARRRAGRPRAGHALGPGLAPGDRPRAVRGAAHALGADGGVHGRHPGLDGLGVRRRAGAAVGPRVRGLPAGPRVHGVRRGRRRGGRARGPPGASRRLGHRAGDRAAARRRAAGDHGRHRACTGPTARTPCARWPRS